ADAVLIMQSLANPSKFGEKGTDKGHITVQGSKNADCSNVGDGVTNKDALAIQKYKLTILSALPEK
ncbi:MAG: glycoside hydrolase, partial [Ruminococcus sp.]|nr:glycoside hydrolase [Ruminococcus sp.]